MNQRFIEVIIFLMLLFGIRAKSAFHIKKSILIELTQSGRISLTKPDIEYQIDKGPGTSVSNQYFLELLKNDNNGPYFFCLSSQGKKNLSKFQNDINIVLAAQRIGNPLNGPAQPEACVFLSRRRFSNKPFIGKNCKAALNKKLRQSHNFLFDTYHLSIDLENINIMIYIQYFSNRKGFVTQLMNLRFIEIMG